MSRGFSLVEVTIALAIAAGGFITLLGLLPQGLEMSRRTSEMAASSRIVEHIAGELIQMSWDDLDWNGHTSSNKGRRYFDDQGIPLADAELAGNSSMLTYVASIYLVPEENTTMGLKLPRAGTASQNEKYVRRAIVFIASTTEKNYVFPNPEERLPAFVSIHPVTIPLVKAVNL